jgi:hypothetical protein
MKLNVAVFWDIVPCRPYVNRRYSETTAHIRTTRRYIPEDVNIHNYRCENLKSYTNFEAVHVADLPRFCHFLSLLPKFYPEHSCSQTSLLCTALNVEDHFLPAHNNKNNCRFILSRFCDPYSTENRATS